MSQHPLPSAPSVLGLALLFACPSSGQGFYYELKTVANLGGLTSAGETLSDIRGVSINESGIIAMAATVTLSASTLQGIYISGSGDVPVALGPASDAVNTANANINADGSVVAWESARTGTPRRSVIRIWDSAHPGTTPPPLITNTSVGFDALLTPPSIANDGTVLFPALEPPRRIYLNTTGIVNDTTYGGTIAPSGQPWVASGGAYVLREGTGTSGSLSVDPLSGPRKVIAQPGDRWFQLGSLPGISDSGKVVAFSGEELVGGQGIFLWLDEPGNPDFADPVRLIGFTEDSRDGLGFADDEFTPVVFDSFDMDQRVGVEHREAGPPGLEGDEILISFVATPKTPSFTNPHTGFPMLFTDKPALWVVHLTPSRSLDGSGPVRLDVKTSPLPVIQVGDFIDGEAVESILTYDPLAFAIRDPDNSPRTTIGPADHYVACEVGLAGGGAKVIRATQLDSDFDGLFDHWEKAGGGLDVDRDGTVDLVLSDFGADPMRKDAFFELDWSAPLRPEPYTDSNSNGVFDLGEPYEDLDKNGHFTVGHYQLSPAALHKIVDKFAAAPLPNPVGPPGITAHIDAGIARSINLPSTAVLAGGDEMRDPDSGVVVEIIYANDEFYEFPITTPQKPYDTVPFQRPSRVFRERYFGEIERNARELVFRHIISGHVGGVRKPGDFLGLSESISFAWRDPVAAEDFVDLDGDGTWFAGDPFEDSNGNGTYDPGEPYFEVRGKADAYDPPEPFTDTNGNGFADAVKIESFRSMPGNSLIIGLGGRDMTSDGNLKVMFPNPGKPVTIPEPAGFLHYQVLYHEVGHSMTLLHGGSDVNTGKFLPTPKSDYRSIMNYRYVEAPDHDGIIIDDFSDAVGPGTFRDWDIFRLDFPRYFDVLNGQRIGSRYVEDPSIDVPDTEITLAELEHALGPLGPPEAPAYEFADADPDLIDSDGDGLVFLIEDALGLDPEVPDISEIPILSGIEGGAPYFQFPRDLAKTITYHPEHSTDLRIWSSDGLGEEIVSTAGTVQTVKVTLGDPVPDTLYFRLRVERGE